MNEVMKDINKFNVVMKTLEGKMNGGTTKSRLESVEGGNKVVTPRKNKHEYYCTTK